MATDLFAAADSILGRQQGGASEPAPGAGPGEFTKGLRAGAYGAGSQLNSLAGLAGENLGLDEFAKGRNAEAERLRARAEENAPRIGSYKQVNSLRSGADYVAGLIGSSVPVMGAGIAGGVLGGGGGAVRGMLGAAAATAPFEIGDTIQKQNADPEAMKAPASTRLRDAALGGGASALAQGLVPGMVGRQILGKAASSVGKQSIKGIIGHNAMDIPLEGLTEGAGEAIKQYGANQDKPFDRDAIMENLVGGAAAGGAFGAAGAGADLAHSRAGGVAAGLGGAVNSARTSINDRLASARQGVADGAAAAADVAGAPAKKFASVSDDIGAFFQKARGAVDDGIDRVAAGQPLGDLAEFASAQGDRAREMMDFSDNESLKKAQVWADEMLNDAGLTPERRQAVAEAAQNITEPAGRAAMAGLRKAWGAGQDALGKVQALRESFGQRGADEATGVKKSEDYSGANKAIADQLGPLLARSQPELVDNPQGLADLADGLRQAVSAMPVNRLSSDTAFRLIDSLGADTAATLDKAYKAVGDKDPVKAESFYKNLNEIADLQQRSATLQDFIGGALTEKSQGLIKPSQLGELVQALVAHAAGEGVDSNAGPHQRATQDRLFRELMAEHFGDKVDAVSLAIEKEAGLRAESNAADHVKLRLDDNGYEVQDLEGGFDDTGRRVAAEPTDSRQYGHNGAGRATVGGNPVMDPDIFMSTRQEGKNHARQLLIDLQGKFPGHDVRFEKMPGSKEMGYVTVEKSADPEGLSSHELNSMRLDTKKYPDSKDRLEVNDMILDTRRIARVMDRKLEYSEVDEQSRAHRLARMFIEGVARITEHNGNFDVPDTAVIGKVGGKNFTYGEAQDLINETKKEGKFSDQDAQALSEMRKRYAQATWSEERLAEAGLKPERLTREALKMLTDEAKDYASRAAFERDRELVQDPDAPNDARGSAARKLDKARPDENGQRRMRPFEERNGHYDKDGNLTNAGAQALLQGDADGGIDVGSQGARRRENANFVAEKRTRDGNQDRLDFTGRNAQEGVREQDRKNAGYGRQPVMYKEGEGRREVNRDENVHLVAAVKGEGKMENIVNMDGSAHSHNASDRTKEDTGGLALAVDGWKRGASKAMGERAERLLKNINAMGEGDRRALASLGGTPAVGKYRGIPPATASQAASTINALARKYKDVILAPGKAGESAMVTKGAVLERNPMRFKDGKAIVDKSESSAPKKIASEADKQGDSSLLEKAIAKRQDYLDNPPDSYSTEVARGHLDWAAKQKERVDAEYEKAVKQGADGERQDQLSDLRGSLGRLIKKAKSVLEGDASLKDFEGGTPDPKSVAAKKAALLEAASSSDPRLLKELSTSSDVKGLQRAVGALPPGKASDAANARLSELVQNPDVAYGLQTKKYSLQSTAIHNDLGRVGFAATHDSPTRHEGKFDWRAHIGKGEGNASFGAGTYLSTSEGVHKNYKRAFSAAISDNLDVHSMPFLDKVDPGVRGRLKQTVDVLVTMGLKAPAEIRDALAASADDAREAVEGMPKSEGDRIVLEAKAMAALARKSPVSDFEYEVGDKKSPTYEVSVGIKPEQLLDWDRPLSEQSALVQKALKGEARFTESAAGVGREIQGSKVTKSWDNGGDGIFLLADGRYLWDDANTMEIEDISGALAARHLDPSGDEMYRAAEERLGSQAKASEYLQSLGILGHKYAASGGKNDALPNYVIYDDSKINTNYVHFSAQATSPGLNNAPGSRANVEAHIEKVLGKSVKLAWANLSHAGEFERMRLNDVIRLSVHALDPMSTAYHESLHAFFAQLKDAKAHDITQVLEKAAQSEHVMAQLTERFKNESAVLAQLADPEERAAYMYQMWASDPSFKVSIAAKGVFGKIADFIRKTLGIWSNDERALHIMEYFNSGEYARNMSSPSVVRAALMDAGHSQAIATARSMAKPLTNLADAVVSTGTARLRDTDIPALNELADLVKREATDASGKDQGFIAAARIERTKRLNDLGAALEGYTPEHMQEAMNALQRGRDYSGPDGMKVRAVQTAIKAMLRDTHSYMVKAGVEIRDLGPGYFPRVWDSHYISKHQTEFKDMLEPYVRSGQFKGNVDEFIRQLGVREGNEFGIETREPGMQFRKERLLNFIKPEDAAMFVNKDLLGTLNSYISQATRRAEWNRRLGEGKLEALYARAKTEGATPEHLTLADNYLKGIDGTLGDDLSPTARRLMGNMIVYQNVRLLPLAMFSSIVDPAGVLVRGGTLKDAWGTFKRGMAEIPESFGRKASSDEGAQMAELVGVIDSALLSSTMGDMYTQGMVGGTAQKINNWFFKANMMEGLNRSFRIGAAEAATRFMARHADGTNTAHSKRWINELGLQAGDVKTMPDGRIALTEADGLSAEQVTRVHAAINQWVDGAVLRPDAADKPLWMNDPHYALIAHLKQFVYSFQKVIIGRVAHEARMGNYTPAMALASYVPIMMAADFAKGLLMGGGDQPEWKKGWGMEDYVGYGVQRAGLLGVGQFGYDVAQDVHRGGLGVGALVGPTIEQFSDAVQLLGGHKQFGPMLLNAMPANALYAHSMGGGNTPDPMFSE